VRLQKKEKRFLSHFENKKTFDLSSTNVRSALGEERGEILPILKIRKHYIYLLQTRAARL